MAKYYGSIIIIIIMECKVNIILLIILMLLTSYYSRSCINLQSCVTLIKLCNRDKVIGKGSRDVTAVNTVTGKGFRA